MRVENLIEDLKDGVKLLFFIFFIYLFIFFLKVKLLALLEVLSGERLPMERGRVLRRPHYLSNCNTALEFLRSKRVRTTSFCLSCKFLSRHAVSASEPFVNTNCSRRVINKTWPKETQINEFQP